MGSLTASSRDAKTSEHMLDFFYDLAQPDDAFREDILKGLGATPKVISPKYLYDETGSEYFEAITGQPEYYPFPTELALLRDAGPDIAAAIGPRAAIIEPGAGASVKIRALLDAVYEPATVCALDISGDHLREALAPLARDYPRVRVGGVSADFTQPLRLPEAVFHDTNRRVVFFPGSTIGNFPEETALSVLKALRAMVRRGDALLIGVDLVKDVATLEAAYDDAAGVTRSFIAHILTRINAELDAHIDETKFAYRARWSPQRSRIEMRLVSTCDQTLQVEGEHFTMAAGEELEVSNSRKFTIEEFQGLAAQAHFAPVDVWTDPKDWYSLHLFEAAPLG